MYNNPILAQSNQLNANNQMLNPQWIQQVKGMMNTVKVASNPQLALNQMLMSNPQLSQAFNLIRGMGNNPQTAFYNYAQQLGLNT